MPPSKEVLADYEAWRASDVTRKARVYEATLYGSNQFHFVVGVSGGDTGLGYTEETEASFLYKDPLRGDYEIFWNRRGRHDLGFMNLGETSKVVWLRPNGLTNANGDPQLKIVAFEGLEPDWGTGIYAEPGGRTN